MHRRENHCCGGRIQEQEKRDDDDDNELARAVLDQVVSLAAASDPDATPHLRLGGGHYEDGDADGDGGKGDFER